MNYEQLHSKYGGVFANESFSACVTGHLLYKQFQKTCPTVAVTEHPFKTWITKHRIPPGATSVSSTTELEEKHGDKIRHLAADFPTGFVFSEAVKKMGIYVTPEIAKRWLFTHGGQSNMQLIDSSGHLELHAGHRIRNSNEANTQDANKLRIWLSANARINVAARRS